MYKSFFNLSRSPFDLTPDPVCFVPTGRHNEALAALYYGVRWHKGFVVVTGEVGTGKTLLLRCLLRLLRGSKDVLYAYLFNSRLSPTEFLQYMLSDFGLPVGNKSKWELLFDLGQFLGSRGARKETTVLIVDEAHHLSEDLLEEIRLLSNLETADDKLLQIVLVGQPELDEKLDSLGLRQLKQRIALRAQLRSLDLTETGDYITQRLQIAGADPKHAETLFAPESIAAVYSYSRGLPRVINTICENALVAAYARQQHTVHPEIIKEVAREFRFDHFPDEEELAAGFPGATRPGAANPLFDMFAMLREPQKSEVFGGDVYADNGSSSAEGRDHWIGDTNNTHPSPEAAMKSGYAGDRGRNGVFPQGLHGVAHGSESAGDGQGVLARAVPNERDGCAGLVKCEQR